MDKREHWIPLLDEDHGYSTEDLTIGSPRKCRCSKKTIIYSIVLGLAIAFFDVAVIVGVTVPFVLPSNTGGGIKPHVLQMDESTTPSLSTMKVFDTANVVQPTMSLPVSSASRSYMSSPSPSPTPLSSPRRTTSLSVSSTSVVRLTANNVISTSNIIPMPTSQPVTPLPISQNENCTIDSQVCPSKLDDRKYRVMTLNNSLRVLLISDPNSNISAAAMDIPAGSFNDPPDYEGLAHFCEHMLFIGTKKYPETNQYSHFLQTHGGRDNAFTSTQNTNYFFNVEADYFSTALDMFAHFFIDPLFSVESVMDEMNAVNAEHQKNLHTDGWKMWQLLKNVSNPLHPFSQFSTGSLETLNKSDVRDRLLHYFNSSYSANTVS
jgi:hypothetical protein